VRVRRWCARGLAVALWTVAAPGGAVAHAAPDAGADLAVAVQASAPAVPGVPLTWTATVTNHGQAAAQGVTFTQTVPLGPGERMDSALSAVGPCSVHTPGTVACDLGQLDADVAVRVVVTQTLAADRTAAPVTTAVVAADGTDAASADNTATATTDVHPLADLTVTGTAAVADSILGGTPTVTLVVSNNGPSVVPAGARASLTLPDPVHFDPARSTAGCAAVGQAVTCTLAKPVAVGSKSATTLVVQGTLAPARPLAYQVSVDAPTGVTDPRPDNNRTSVANPGSADSDVAVVAAGPGDPVEAGTTASMTYTVTNHGPADATGVTLSATLPDGLALDSSATGCAASGPVVTCPAAPQLRAGDSVAQVVTVRVDPARAAGTAVVDVRVGVAGPGDPNGAERAASAPVVVVRRANLSLDATRDGPLDAGGAVSYQLTVHNFGPSTATGVVITDRLPPELTVGSAYLSGGTCAVTGALHTCTVRDPLAVDASAVVHISGTVDATVAGDTVNDSAFASSLDPEPDAGDNLADSAGVVQGTLRVSTQRQAPESAVRRALAAGGRLAWWSWAGGGALVFGLVLLGLALRRGMAARSGR